MCRVCGCYRGGIVVMDVFGVSLVLVTCYELTPDI